MTQNQRVLPLPGNKNCELIHSCGFCVPLVARVRPLVSAVVVPANALFRDGDGFSTFLVRGQHAKKVKVEIGARTPDWAEPCRRRSRRFC